MQRIKMRKNHRVLAHASGKATAAECRRERHKHTRTTLAIVSKRKGIPPQTSGRKTLAQYEAEGREKRSAAVRDAFLKGQVIYEREGLKHNPKCLCANCRVRREKQP